MNMPGFNAESSLGPSTSVYRRRYNLGVSATERATGAVSPALKRARFCQRKYKAYISHHFPTTVCESIFPDLENAVAMAAPVPSGGETPFTLRASRSFRPSNRFGLFQRCRTVALPFIGEVTTTQNCEDSIPDSSVLEVSGHPELATFWTGGINEIPPPNNPGWFGFVNETCSCCGGKVECPDGTCIPPNQSCTQHPA